MTSVLCSSGLSRDDLRRQLRQRRRILTTVQQQQASTAALRNLMKHPRFIRSQHVALYLASDSELDPTVIATQLWKMNKHCYLPVLHPNRPREMWFIHFSADTPLKTNRYGIGEPDPFSNHKLPANLLDIVLLPLVGFDRAGARLGMGGGFYDTTFAFKLTQSSKKPWLIGLAHHCQEVDKLETEAWDVPLSAVVTDREIITLSGQGTI